MHILLTHSRIDSHNPNHAYTHIVKHQPTFHLCTTTTQTVRACVSHYVRPYVFVLRCSTSRRVCWCVREGHLHTHTIVLFLTHLHRHTHTIVRRRAQVDENGDDCAVVQTQCCTQTHTHKLSRRPNVVDDNDDDVSAQQRISNPAVRPWW